LGAEEKVDSGAVTTSVGHDNCGMVRVREEEELGLWFLIV